MEADLGKEAPKLLDADTLIDEILAKKGPQEYKGGLSEENWEQELEQIPLFMGQSPEAVDPEKAPALAALQDLKYELSTPGGRATAHKEEGNEHFRHKRYRQAVEEYTAGLKEGVGLEAGLEAGLRAVLCTNRAAAHFHLGNFRSCLNDVTEAKKLKPDHLKALHRGAVTCMRLERYEEVLEWCDQGLRVDPKHAKLRELRSKASKEKKQQERDWRKKAMATRAKEEERKKLLEAIKGRGIQLSQSVSLDGSDDGPHTPPVELMLEGSHPTGDMVHFDPEGRLVWPVLFLYPEFGETDLISAFNEEQRFEEHLAVMFGGDDRPGWDKQGHYTPDTIQIYFEDSIRECYVKVDPTHTLKQVLSTRGYTVGAGTPSFFLLSSESSFSRHFLQRSS